MKLTGIFPPIATPFDHKGEIYKAKLEHNVSQWNRTGLSGYVVCGSTGESVLLASDEKLRLWEWVAEYSAPEKILIAGSGAESVRETVQLTNCAAGMGYKAALVMTPHFFKSLFNRVEAQLIYYRTVADQSKIPILLYNYPQVSGIDLMPEAIAMLSEHPNIIGMKDSSGNLEKIVQTVREAKPGFQLLSGNEMVLEPSLAAGCVGAILASANAIPYATISIWEAHRTRETDAARDWQARILPAARVVAIQYGIPGLKYAMDLKGYYGGPVRLPLTPVGPDAQREIAEAFEGLKG